jgi:hypothetical protein
VLQSSTCGDVALKRREHYSRTLRFGFWWSARRVKGAARAWVCRWCGSVRLLWDTRGSARREEGRVYTPVSGWHVCTGSGCARAGSQDACAGWERAGHGWRGACVS